ncbi:phage tail protein [Mucilaginibacter phyllosphaerae]|uniref:Phage tail protein n=1 Tax=Mucilaginibacter phyllosphaerae TaxID=1812349 RepID=A0A4Y8AC80_9SPHI|nr:phage tail protein [Mucilaginibacter phyllosphaerae]
MLEPDLLLTHRFGVFFFQAGVLPNMLDIRFQKVSGLQADINMDSINEGGQNLYTHRIPTGASYSNLVLERGLLSRSLLNRSFQDAFSEFRFSPSNVLVTVFNDENKPASGWLFLKAYPVKWSFSNLDASANEVVIETMELAYTSFQTISV